MELIVKVMGADGLETLYPGVIRVTRLNSFADIVMTSDTEVIEETGSIVKVKPVCVMLALKSGSKIAVTSEFPVYAMNESGKTVQSFRPEVLNRYTGEVA